MLTALQDIQVWDRLDISEKTQIAREVEQLLPDFGVIDDDAYEEEEDVEEGEEYEEVRCRLQFVEIRKYVQGDQEHEIALFRGDERTMLLIPGGMVELGYAPDHPDFPSNEQIQTWNEKYVKPHGFPSLKDFVLEQLSPLRTVTITPFIIDQEPIEPRWDPAFHDQIRNLLKPRGWSLPSDDEWEWAYSGGTRQIFPWGGINPFPKDSGAYPLSAFGFSAPESTYHHELVGETGERTRGGDGGVSECGGWGGMVQGIIYACSYVDPSAGEAEPWQAHFRRCYRIQV